MAEELDDLDARIGRIDDLLAPSVQPTPLAITMDEVRAFVDSQSNCFQELLLGSPERVKSEFQKRIKTITLTPSIDERGPVFKVSSDVDLFSLSEDVMQTNPVDLIGLHYTVPISFGFVPYKQAKRQMRNVASLAVDTQTLSNRGLAPQPQERHYTGAEDDLFAAVQRIDTDALLQAVYKARGSQTFTWPGDRVCDSSLAEPCTFRDGFGGLRLAAVEPEPETCEELAA